MQMMHELQMRARGTIFIKETWKFQTLFPLAWQILISIKNKSRKSDLNRYSPLNAYNVVISTWIYAVCWLIHANCIDILNDAGIVTWWLNMKWTICMLQLIHYDHRPNAQFASYRYEYLKLVLFARLHVMTLGQWYS